jgi:hypothetical protein
VALEEIAPLQRPVNDVWEAQAKIRNDAKGTTGGLEVGLSVTAIKFYGSGAVEVVGTDNHAGFLLDMGAERDLDLPVPRYKCATAGDGEYGIAVTAVVGGDLISNIIRGIWKASWGLLGDHSFAVKFGIPVECVAAEPTTTSSTTTSSTTTSTSTTSTTIAAAEFPPAEFFGCGPDWFEHPLDPNVIEHIIELVGAADEEHYAEILDLVEGGYVDPETWWTITEFDDSWWDASVAPRPWAPRARYSIEEIFRHHEPLDIPGCVIVTHSDGTMTTYSDGPTLIIRVRTADGYLTWEQLQAMFGNTEYPCGAGERGYTLCGDLAFPEGDAVLVDMSVGGPIPLGDPEHHYQYGFVFDADGDPANNYIPSPQYPGDFFTGTDLWYVASYAPGAGWSLQVTGPNFMEQPSAARVIIGEWGLSLVVPAAEIGDLEAARYRVTAFRHLGDWGINPPHYWNGDTYPRVEEGLAPLTGP